MYRTPPRTTPGEAEEPEEPLEGAAGGARPRPRAATRNTVREEGRELLGPDELEERERLARMDRRRRQLADRSGTTVENIMELEKKGQVRIEEGISRAASEERGPPQDGTFNKTPRAEEVEPRGVFSPLTVSTGRGRGRGQPLI